MPKKRLTYDDMVIWSRDFDLMNNRKRIINQILGEQYPDSIHSRLRVFYKHGEYHVEFGDTELGTFGMYDVAGLRDALCMLDVWSDCVWHLRRAGLLAA